MATKSVATKSPELPDYTLHGTARSAAWQNVDRSIAALEVIAEATHGKDGCGDAVATVAGAINEWLVQVMQILDEAPQSQGAQA